MKATDADLEQALDAWRLMCAGDDALHSGEIQLGSFFDGVADGLSLPRVPRSHEYHDTGPHFSCACDRRRVGSRCAE